MEVEGVGKVPISDVQVGASVLVRSPAGSLVHEQIIAQLHTTSGEGKKDNLFVAITHSNGIFRATPGHIVFRLGEDGAVLDTPVSGLQVGDSIMFARQGKTAKSTVLAVHHNMDNVGMYAPLTSAGTLVVDGIIASSYATPSLSMRLPHSVAHSFMFPVRLWHRFLEAVPLGRNLKVPMMESADRLHPFLQMLYPRVERIPAMLTFVK